MPCLLRVCGKKKPKHLGEMKRMWMYVAIALVVGALILGGMKYKGCGNAKKAAPQVE